MKWELNKGQKIIKTMVQYLGIFILLNLIGVCGLYISQRIPTYFIYDNIVKSVSMLEEDGIYRNGMDGYTDLLIMSSCYIQNDGTVKSSLQNNVSKLGIESYMPLEGIIELLNNPESYASYSNYFVGIVSVFKILFFFFSLEEIREILVIGLVCLFSVICVLTNKQFDWRMTLAVLTLFLGAKMFSMVCCLTYSVDIYIMTLAILCVLWIHRTAKEVDMGKFFFTVGVLTFFLNYWSLPLISLCPALTIHVSLLIKNTKVNKALRDFFGCSVAWFIGYTGEVVFRILSAKFVSDGGTSIAHLKEYTTAGVFDRGYGRLKSTYLCLANYFTTINKILFIIVLVIIFATGIKSVLILIKYFNTEIIRIIVVYFGLFMIPLVWLTILYNHTFHGFDNMIICSSVFSFFSCVYSLINYSHKCIE